MGNRKVPYHKGVDAEINPAAKGIRAHESQPLRRARSFVSKRETPIECPSDGGRAQVRDDAPRIQIETKSGYDNPQNSGVGDEADDTD